MKVFTSETSSVVVVERGEELLEVLNRYASNQNLKSAWLTGLGGASEVTISWYDIETQQYVDRTVSNALEILSLTGNMSTVDDKPFWHIHGTFSAHDYTAFGGHVKRLLVGLTCELHITHIDADMTRKYDDETGLKILQR